MKIYRINDCDWWMAESKEQAIADYRTHISDDLEYSNPDEVLELSEKEMDERWFCFWDLTKEEIEHYREQFASLGIALTEDENKVDDPCVTFHQEMRRRLKFHPQIRSEMFASTEH